MKVLITGGAGFIGSHIADLLIKKGHSVVVIDDLSSGDMRNVPPKARFHKISVASPHLQALFEKEKPDMVCHTAAKTNMRATLNDPLKDIPTNLIGTVKVMECAKKSGVAKVVFSSTGGALYGDAGTLPTTEDTPTNPISPYGVDKLASEKYLYYYHAVHGISATILRYSNVYGPRMERKRGGTGVVAVFLEAFLNNKKPKIFGDGKQTRDFVFVEDVAEANYKALIDTRKGFFYYNVSGGKEVSMNELAKQIGQITNRDGAIEHLPANKGEVRRSCLANKKIQKELDWKPRTTLKEGIQKTLSSIS
ncbi:UDP-glucose 4-epimerase [Candidatus Kaiserbacteria bacterium CG10_big_fil_rev_8_21_14_0_10_49_17]|uniref:UDP-glucose 4-epimerase n=1 Tax=Candidatus Kaiserbacteria bacterium CG10_big_fil_rev_8_21_14_0_10_49_17 TaxID=1974609 RepID=A0A2M6WE37_9BACT|nr:MAG: UDP-glucose 4-epimerase [Candidatus Kaiserbacteria bacterium CG10_big_fil_rev_8_21_14_0_10_49_17]